MYKVVNDETAKIENGHRPANYVLFSMLREFYTPVSFNSFSIKYVTGGKEVYTINGNRYTVNAGQYMLANKFCEGFVEIESRETVKGICIGIEPGILSEAVAAFIQPDTPFPAMELDIFFNTPAFFENRYEASQTRLGQLLLQLNTLLESNPYHIYEFIKEFYFNLSEQIIADHIPLYRQLQSIPTIKAATRKDLLRRLSRGKEFIDVYFAAPLDIATVAREALISEYHFFRLFKTVFGLSPHQYIIQKRLEYGYKILEQLNAPVSVAAIDAGFSDIYSFSKAFRKRFGISPSAIHKK
jgi:AraC family transcriptional regulator